MKKLVGFTVAGGLLVMAGCAAKEPAPLAPPPPPEVVSEEKVEPGRVEKTNTITVTAVVTAVDQKKRLVTLLGADGEKKTIHVSDEVRNLPQVKRGDEVQVSYYESALFELRKKGQAKPGAAMVEEAARAKQGEMPGAIGGRVLNVTATVQKVDKKTPSLTLKGPDGNVFTLPVKDASRLDPVKVGDLLEITYTQAMAIAVEKPSKSSK